MKVILIIFLVVLFSVSSVYATTFANLHLDSIPEGINENNIITFSGQLTTQNGIAIPHRTIFIQDDTAYTRPESILTITVTDDSGKFSTSWKVIPKDNGHSYHFFANFLGGNTYGFTRSETYESFVQLAEPVANQIQTQSKLPDWFEAGSKMWHDGQIRDVDYAYGINNLAYNGIMQKPNQISSTILIPAWVKNTANWYADGQISDGDFLNTIQYLINIRIMTV